MLALGVFSVLALGSCGTPIFQSLSPAVKETLVGISGRYLTYIAAGEEQRVIEMVYWPEFSEDGEFTREDFHRQFVAIKNRWPITQKDHPLLGLKVLGVSGGENSGEVRLAKDPKFVAQGANPGEEIRVKFIWAGTGWIVRKDSLFGKDNYFAQFVPKN